MSESSVEQRRERMRAAAEETRRMVEAASERRAEALGEAVRGSAPGPVLSADEAERALGEE